MSFTLMAKAIQIKTGSPARKLVLLKLADNASDDGFCFPSYQHIADQCEMSRRSVISHIKALEEMGLLRKKERKLSANQNSSNVYELNLGSENSAPPSEKVAPPPSENSAPITYHSSKPIKEPIIIPPAQSSAADEIINHLNQVAGTNYQAKAQSNIRLIEARLKEASVEEIKAVIDKKTAEWINNPKMAGYLRPSTLFNATKFHDYLGQLNRPTNLSYNYDQPNQKKGLTDIINGWED